MSHRHLRTLFQALVMGLIGAGAIACVTGAKAPGIPATVAWAKSGQTLELLAPLNQDFPVETVRLAGIIAPAIGQTPWDQAAQDCLGAIVHNQHIRVVPTEATPDAYGRLWAEVWQGGQLVNAALLKKGCALLDEAALATQPHRRAFIYAQAQARILGLGIWDPQRPLRQHPREFSAS